MNPLGSRWIGFSFYQLWKTTIRYNQLPCLQLLETTLMNWPAASNGWLRISCSTISTALRHTSRAFLMSPATADTFRAQNWMALGSITARPSSSIYNTFTQLSSTWDLSTNLYLMQNNLWIGKIMRKTCTVTKSTQEFCSRFRHSRKFLLYNCQFKTKLRTFWMTIVLEYELINSVGQLNISNQPSAICP